MTTDRSLIRRKKETEVDYMLRTDPGRIGRKRREVETTRPDALQDAISALGAVEVAPGRYAFQDSTGWMVAPTETLLAVQKVQDEAEAGRSESLSLSLLATVAYMPAWWTPERRFRGWVPYDGPHNYLSAEQARFHGCAVVETADLETGEEMPC